ncbi:hypothetical protein [Paenibacillus sp. NEAU-GSW1]|uniref:hypothetical protein n=1 Tax=Paenibacillus sp. NEAU-GSW1 TaxID=2682486 RepID=UPI0012E2FD36|nr:hypothetical protein [Paenibacillus sp. NEAU-GSW1]MUT66991.1 hypothetical protein [Paenibacillus sp. NEAU-GSW1]
MKKVIMAIIVVLIIAACGQTEKSKSSPLDLAAAVQSTDLSSELGQLDRFNASEQEVLAALGEPELRLETKKGESVFQYSGYNYVLYGGKVVQINVEAGQLTAKGLQIGDQAERIADVYGPNYYERNYEGLSIQGYLDKENKRVIEFIKEEERIAVIAVSDYSIFER